MRSIFALIAFAVFPALAAASTAAVSPIVFEEHVALRSAVHQRPQRHRIRRALP